MPNLTGKLAVFTDQPGHRLFIHASKVGGHGLEDAKGLVVVATQYRVLPISAWCHRWFPDA